MVTQSVHQLRNRRSSLAAVAGPPRKTAPRRPQVNLLARSSSVAFWGKHARPRAAAPPCTYKGSRQRP